MSPEVEAAIIAAGVGILTFLGAAYGTYRTSRDTKDALKEQLTKQGEQLDETLRAQSDQLDRTLAEQRTRTLNERFATAASQLGDDRPAMVRLAGVYAMAALADDWEENRQACVDVLCGYLRMPYEPDAGAGAAAEKRLAFEAGREVRHTAVRTIAAHLRDGVQPSWQALKFDFTGAVFDGADFSGAVMRGGQVSFTGATFSAGTVDFSEATFSGGRVSFTGATFSGGTVDFSRATFTGGRVDFTGSTFSGGTVDFSGATFSGGQVYFGATFSGSTVKFAYATFCGADVGFRDAIVSSGTLDFEGATISKNAAFSGKVWFGGATFSGGTMNLARITLSGGTLGFRGAAFSGGTIDFTGATFSGGLVDFSSVAEWSRPPMFDFTWESRPREVKPPAEIGGRSRDTH
jgi:uncharacterized protein YjbI with pentapeptide repeats